MQVIEICVNFNSANSENIFMEEPNWKDLLAFSKRERNGILTLLVLIVLTLLVRLFIPDIINREVSISDEALRRMDSLQKKIVILKQQEKKKRLAYSKPNVYYPKKKNNTRLTPFAFNPNELDRSGWKKLGFSDHDVNMIMNFRKAGGSFYKKEDIKKLYCISENQYKKLEPYVQLDSTQKQMDHSTISNHAFEGVVNLNSADTVDLLKIPGIGPFYARQILKYRKMLGGYVKPEQISEVYGLEQKYQKFLPYLNADSVKVHKIDINKAKYYDILKHPYVDKRLAYQITEFRRLNGDFNSVEDIRKIKNLPDSLIKRILPYLKIQ